MRRTIKIVILGLAAFGAYRIYELVQARAQIATPPVNDALDTVKTTAAKVKDELSDAQAEIVEDVKTAVAPAADAHATPEPRMAVADDVADPVDSTT